MVLQALRIRLVATITPIQIMDLFILMVLEISNQEILDMPLILLKQERVQLGQLVQSRKVMNLKRNSILVHSAAFFPENEVRTVPDDERILRLMRAYLRLCDAVEIQNQLLGFVGAVSSFSVNSLKSYLHYFRC